MSQQTRKPTTQLTPQASDILSGQPFLHPSLATSPAAQAHAAGMAARADAARQGAGGLSKYTAARPGQPPAMPPLEGQHVPGMTMEAQAAMHGPRPEQVAARSVNTGSIIQTDHHAVPMMGAQAQRPPQFSSADMLPPIAANDPAYIRGAGSEFAINQPNLAMKYGVVRNGIHIPPQEVQAGRLDGTARKAGRSPTEIQNDLNTLAGLQTPKELPATEEEAEEQVSQTAAGQSQYAGAAPSTDDDLRNRLAALDDFDFDALRRQLHLDELNNKAQRSMIEGRLQPIDLNVLIMHDRVSQDVIVIPNRLIYTFTSMTSEDDLHLKRLLMLESKSVEVTERYMLDKFAIMSLTAGLTRINNNPVPSHIGTDGKFNDELFWDKFTYVTRRPLHMIASMGINHTWFEARVRKLFVAENVKNG